MILLGGEYMRSNEEAVNQILCDMRKAIDAGLFIPVDRYKNFKTLAKLGLTWTDVKDEIYTLTRSNYIKGPEDDRDDPSSDKFWFFKKKVENNIIYIKFKVLYQYQKQVKVVSFHIDFM
jgi:hypothetical protein